MEAYESLMHAEDKPASRGLDHLFLFLCLLSAATFFAWAYLGELEVVSHAPGVIEPAGQVKRVQHLEGGIVNKILVREGDLVKPDQVLVRLAATVNRAEVDELKQRMLSQAIRMERLRAEVEGKENLVYARDRYPGQRKLLDESIRLFQARKSRLETELRVQQTLVEQHRYTTQEIGSRIKANRETLKFLQEQVKVSENLLESDLSNRMEHLRLLKERSRIEGQLAQDNARSKQIAAALAEAEQRRTLVRSSFLEESQKELDEVTSSYDILGKRIRKAEDALRRTVIRSPVTGRVKELHLVTLGGVLPPGGAVADIVPVDDTLVIEAKLPPGDISHVKPGQKSLIRLASADGIRFGEIQGTVEQVSPDTLKTERGQPYYKLRISTRQDYFENAGERYPFAPGMLVECSIITGMRSVMDYLLEPLINANSKAMRER
jgi:adhesin transport system membrane fusion protein